MSNIATSIAPAIEAGVGANAEAKAATRGLRLAHLWVLVPLAIAWFAGSIDFIEPYDFWWNVKSGQIMMQTGQFLGTDVLVWTPVREPYSNPQWGSQLLFYWLYNASPYLLLALRALIVTATVGVVLWLCFWKTRSVRIASLVAVLAYLTAWTNYGMRPQLFAFLPFIGFLFLLERKDTHPKWLPLLVPIMLFWANVHGSFFLGVALMGIYSVGTLLEKMGSKEGRKWLISKAAGWQALWLGAAALVTLANPYFLFIYNYFFIATNDPIARALNVEWQAPTIYGGTGQLFFLNLFVFVVSIYLSRRRMRPTEILLVLAFGYLSLVSLRNVMWWGWITAPIIAANFAAWRAVRGQRSGTRDQGDVEGEGVSSEQESLAPDPRPLAPRRTEIPAFNWLIAGLLVGGALLFTPLWRQANPLVPAPARAALSAETPTKLAQFLGKGEVPAPIFNYMEWGGYLAWELYPRYRMFVDGRFEARKVEVWNDYLSVSRGRADWQKTLDRYGVKTLVLNKEFHDDLIPLVAQDTTWRKVYEDKAGIVFTR
jgi:hypothetical protein